ncbi:MAG: DUF885 family protein [Acidobacteria bacterium]|nr:DUF885 family protein [Acidobacteriota bacterium]MCA1637537.1 DUF885 family protein [Acidobacteriota bacterium]
MKETKICVLFILAIAFTACQQPANSPQSNQTANTNTNAANASNQWDKYVEGFLNEYFTTNPQFAVYQGKHEFDGKLPDWSEEGLKKEIVRLKAERDKATAFKNEQLDERQRFERDYLIAQIDKDLFWRETADQPHTNPYFYSDSLDPDVYVSREYAPLDTRIKSYTAYAKNVPNALAQIKTNLKLPLPKTLVKIGRTTIGGLGGLIFPKARLKTLSENRSNSTSRFCCTALATALAKQLSTRWKKSETEK